MPLIDPALLVGRLPGVAGRFDVDAVDSIDSTNSELMRRAASGAASGSVLVADTQTGGRGRRGRQWQSNPQDSLTFSLFWRFDGGPAKLAGLSLAVGVAVADALATLGVCGVGLKWPNDVLLRRGDEFAKLAGILIELSSERQAVQAVIGIGLNLRAPAEDFGQPVAGLGDGLAALPDRHDVLAAILAELARVLDRFAADGFVALQAAWQRRHAWQDEPVRLMEDGKVLLEGICRGVDAQGALRVETASGVETVYVGDVSLRRA